MLNREPVAPSAGSDPGEVGILVLVEVDRHVAAEVDGVRAGSDGAVEEVRVEELRRERLPSPVLPP
jgi:hypothetical protein